MRPTLFYLGQEGFRDLTIAATLKLVDSARMLMMFRSFRDLTIAATLKLVERLEGLVG